jgi:predicted N-acetyltransferase YhbS
MNFVSSSPDNPLPDGADAQGVCASGARCSLWWTAAPQRSGQRTGVIGHFAAPDAAAGCDALAAACVRLRAAGCTVAVGPMDGTTWRRYRVVTERGVEPPFFLEPDNPDWWAEAFAAAGFRPLAGYSSSLVTDLAWRDPRAARAWDRLAHDGVTIRALDPENFLADLRAIFQVSLAAFASAFLYTPIEESTFLAQYTPYRDKIRPDLVFLAECDGEVVGYVFAIPDFAEALRGEPVHTVIGKTLAVRPGVRFGGLGLVLAERLHAAAAVGGFARVIHALQFDGNARVRSLSGNYGTIMRRYTLFHRPLA